MKNLILALSLLLTSSISTSAQQAPGTLQIGLVAGPSQTNLSIENKGPVLIEPESDYRFAAGISAKYQFNRAFLKTGFLYENKGFKSDVIHTYDRTSKITYTDLWNYHYLTVPVLVGMNIQETGLFINGGPYMGFLLSQTITFKDLESTIPVTLEIENTSDWKKLDVGFSVGAGYEKAITTSVSASAEIRHNVGLQNIGKGSVEYKTRSTNLLVGLHYTLPSK